LNHFNRVGAHPDIDLLKAIFEKALKFQEEISNFRLVRHVDKHANKIVEINLPRMLPLALNRLRLRGNRAELLSQLDQRFTDELVWDIAAVIEPQGKQYFVSSEFAAHRQPPL